ncbi:MAG: hypothetical protein M1835_000892, partial [Candelina submexicana]
MAEEVAALATDLARSALEQRVRDSSTGLAGAALEGLYNQGASKLITLYEGSNTPSTSAIVDIVAVHGFGGHPYGTWTADSKLWLRDLLPEDIPNSRILTYGYSVSSGGTISSGNLLHAAQGLLDRLSRLREGKLKRDRPITFICHSLGGLIVIKALLLTEELWQYERLRLATRGIIFLGTPLRISGLQHVNDGVLSLLRIAGLTSGLRAPYSANDNKILSRDSIRYYKNLALLRNLGDDEKEFQKLLQSTDAHINVFSFFETKATEGIGMAVSKALTNLNNSNVELLPLDANHAELAKFSNRSSD